METITRRDVTFTFLGPVVFEVSLLPEDTFAGMEIVFYKTQERIRINEATLLYLSIRTQTVTRRVHDPA